MTATLDATMEAASRALAAMDYARCEALCVQALARARDAGDWAMYQRVLLPLQEARRQKRQAAIDGLILLGTPDDSSIESLLADERAGCFVLTQPHTVDDAAKLDTLARAAHRPIEVLYADNDAVAATWRITAYHDDGVSTDLPAPDTAWVGRWIAPLSIKPPTPAHWFMRASEALGDTALAAVDAPSGTVQRLQQLERALAAAGDHEILHQRLADAARALQGAGR